MAYIEAAAPARGGVPARANSAAAAGGVKAYACHHEEDVSSFRVECQPSASAGAAPVEECVACGMSTTVEKSGFAQHEGCGAGAIICGVDVTTVSATAAIRFVDDSVTCGNNALDARRGMSGCNGPTITQHVRCVPCTVLVARRICVLLHLLL